MKTITKNDISVVILAGGRALRMNGKDKGLILLNNKPLVAYVADIVSSKVKKVFISCNRNIEKYQKFGQVIVDDLDDFQGPLAGISKAMKKADTKYLLILPCDSPFINEDLIDKLIKNMTGSVDICMATDGVKMQPTFALIRTSLKDNLDSFLDKGERKLGLWLKSNKTIKVDFKDKKDIFINLNSPQDFDKYGY